MNEMPKYYDQRHRADTQAVEALAAAVKISPIAFGFGLANDAGCTK